MATGGEAVAEFGPLGLGADQAEVAMVAAGEDGIGQLQVQGVIMGHDDVVGTRRHASDLVDRLVGEALFHAGGQDGGKFLGPRVDPAHRAGQSRQQRYQGPGDMAGAKDDHRDVLRQLGFEQQGGDAATALAEAGGQGETLQARLAGAGGEHFPGDVHRAVFEMTATDSQVLLLASYQHLGAGLTGRGTLFVGYGDQHAGFAACLEVGQQGQPATFGGHAGSSVAGTGVVCSSAARRRMRSTPQSTRSGVAGASSAGWKR